MVSMIEQLFGSKTRVKLLKLFYGNPNRAFYVREITRKIDEQINSVRRELSNLLSVGIITSDNINNKLYYEVNQKYEYYDPLLIMFGGKKVKNLKSVEDNEDSNNNEDEYKALGHVDLIAYSGKLTRDLTSPVEVLIVGNVNKNAVDKYIAGVEADEGMEIRYTVMKPDEFMYRQQIHDRFITQILKAKKQILLDKKNILASK
jgi:hypothetical protein